MFNVYYRSNNWNEFWVWAFSLLLYLNLIFFLHSPITIVATLYMHDTILSYDCCTIFPIIIFAFGLVNTLLWLKFYTLIHYVVITKDTSLIVTTIFSHQTHTLHSTCYGMHAKNKISSWFIRVIWNIAALWLALRPSSCSTRSSTMLLDLITISSNGHPLCLLLVSYRPITCNNCNELVIFGSEI